MLGPFHSSFRSIIKLIASCTIVAAWYCFSLLAIGLGDDKLPPNIVLVFVDDLGITDLGCYGRSEHSTPNLDAFAASGTRYTNAYCGLSICSASRAALMTGKSPSRLHLTSYLPGRADAPSQKLLNARIHSALPLEEKTIAEELKLLGYRTGLFGKWHLGGGEHGPTHQGFDIAVEAPARGSLGDISTAEATGIGGGKSEFLITREAIKFMNADDSSPFFCYIPHHIPHIMLEATEDDLAKHKDAYSPLYAANMESMDHSFGILMSAIEKLPTTRDTLVIFTSDNGGLHVPELHPEPVSHNAPFRAGKGYLYEGGLRIPFLVRSMKGKIGSGRVVDEPISQLDLFPTLIRSAGGKVSTRVGPIDGVDLYDHWFQGKSLPTDRSLYWDFPHYTNQGSRPASAMRQGNWKLVFHHEDETVELFNLAADPQERNNLADREPQKAASMTARLMKWRDSVGAQRCTPNPEWDPELHRKIYVDKDSTKLEADRTAKEIGLAWREWRSLMDQAVQGRKSILKSPEGTITLWASEAKAHGKNIRYEPEPYKNVVGYWTEVDDWAEWQFTVPEDGEYEIEMQYGCGGGNGGSRVNLVCQDQTIEFTVKETGHFQHMIYEPLGALNLKMGQASIEVRPQNKTNIAVMDIRKIVLRKK